MTSLALGPLRTRTRLTHDAPSLAHTLGMLALGGVQCDHVNSLRDELRTPPWRTLLRRAGA